MDTNPQSETCKRLVTLGVARTENEAETLIATHGPKATAYALEALSNAYAKGQRVTSPAAYFRKCAALYRPTATPGPPAPIGADDAKAPRRVYVKRAKDAAWEQFLKDFYSGNPRAVGLSFEQYWTHYQHEFAAQEAAEMAAICESKEDTPPPEDTPEKRP